MARAELPRLVIAGLSGDSGKTLVSLGLAGALRSKGFKVAPFKKGPDFIDAAWLTAAAGVPARNLDTFLFSKEKVLASLSQASLFADVALVEGNRGLFDGFDSLGSHSTAQLAKLTKTPVVLVVDVTKMTRTVAALVKGCQALDPELLLAGVILNRVGTKRQENVIREALAHETGLPVLGAIPKLKNQHLPSRHLGLVTAMEHPDTSSALQAVACAVEQYVDISSCVDLARQAESLEPVKVTEVKISKKPRVCIGVLKDKAFSFYYPENFTSLEDAGAELVFISPIEDEELPDIDALYAGGGFPEVYAAELSQNQPLRESLAKRIDEGLPVWAECGGLIYLSSSLYQDGNTYPMVGALPVVVEQTPRPQGHGYVQARVDQENTFLKEGTELNGHEFHYSRLKAGAENVSTVFQLQRGVGVGRGRDGIHVGSTVATYTHLHALGAPEWADSLVRASEGGLQ
ncbi:MAG: hydrogenobyrinic acid a,c-diamide synthase (glutamine-hydrolyzing) [Proteobacteria bacterium]|nr:hydrogenobyrinic acid a,c-diamide synthase (glutamine-hydrolyzing) [Pseudomonadota bacterium]